MTRENWIKIAETLSINKDRVFKIFLSIIEGICFLLMIIFAVITGMTIASGVIFEFSDLATQKSFRGFIIVISIFILSPIFWRFFFKWLDQQIVKMHFEIMKDLFLDQIKSKDSFAIEDIANKFQVSTQMVKDYCINLVENQELKGKFQKELTREYFIVAPDFLLQTLQERRIANFKEHIAGYLKSYKWVTLDKMAKAFQLTKKEIEELLQEQLELNRIRGYIDGDNFVQDLGAIFDNFRNSSELEECPYCDNKNLPNSHYCRICGKNISIDLDDI